MACIPALAALALIFLDDLQGQYAGQVSQLNQSIANLRDVTDETLAAPAALEALHDVEQAGKQLEETAGNPMTGLIGEPQGPLGKQLQTLRMLAGGFIITSLLWASALASMIDRKLWLAAVYFGIAAGCSLFGLIHSPMPGSPLVNPASLPANLPHNAAGQTPFYMATAYFSVALLLLAWDFWMRRIGDHAEEPPHHEEPAV